MDQTQPDTQETVKLPARPRESTDSELVAEVLRKDRKATAEFVARYTDPVYGYVRRRLIPRTDLVDDLVQEIFLAAWTSGTRHMARTPESMDDASNLKDSGEL